MDLKLPALGEGADSGTVVNLFVKEGDQITKDQPILELENEKAVATIPSTAAGVVTKIFVKPGDKLNVGQRILAFNQSAAAPSQVRAPEVEEGELQPKPGVTPAAAPSIRKLARDLAIDLTRVRGSA